MKKIVFDVEDHPPLSYYKDSEGVVVDSSNTVVTNQPSSLIDKSEWSKAPEFVPKTFNSNIEMPSVHHHMSDNSSHRLQQRLPEITDKQQNVAICQQMNFPHHSNLPLPMPMPMPTPGAMRQYPPPIFPFPMPRPFLPQLPVLPQMHPFGQFQRQPSFRQPRPYPRGVTLNNTGIPSGYTANMTTINAGLGGQIPAIVIKKKRKKKSKRGKDLFSTSMYESDKVEIMEDLKSKESTPDDKSSTTASQPEFGRSEPDLMRSSNFPADLDLIQSTTNCAMLTGSWPDLSEPQRQMINNSGMYEMYYEDHGLECDDQIVFDSRLKQDAFTHSSKNWDENENEETALLDDNQGLQSKENSQRKTLENISGRNVIVRSTVDGTTSQLLPPETVDDKTAFKGNRRRTLSLPDVPLVTSSGSKVCCSVM